MADSRGNDRFGRWLTLGANVGVVLGLVLLIVEVRQNASLTRTAMELQKTTRLPRSNSASRPRQRLHG
jgi:hypothetical protein